MARAGRAVKGVKEWGVIKAGQEWGREVGHGRADDVRGGVGRGKGVKGE